MASDEAVERGANAVIGLGLPRVLLGETEADCLVAHAWTVSRAVLDAAVPELQAKVAALEARVEEAERARDAARVTLAVFNQIADETIDEVHDASWFRALLRKRLGDLGPAYEIDAYLQALREHDESVRRAAAAEGEVQKLREAVTLAHEAGRRGLATNTNLILHVAEHGQWDLVSFDDIRAALAASPDNTREG